MKVNLEELFTTNGIDAYIWLDENLNYLSSNLDKTDYSLDNLLKVSQDFIRDHRNINEEIQLFLLIEKGVLYINRMKDRSYLLVIAGHQEAISLPDLNKAVTSIESKLSLQ